MKWLLVGLLCTLPSSFSLKQVARLERDALLAHTNLVPGVAAPVAVVCIADWVDGTPKQRLQKELVANWARTTRAAGLECSVVLCTPLNLTHSDVQSLSKGDSCAVLHSTDASCLQNTRLGRWSVVRSMLQWGISVINSDPDAVFTSTSFIPYLSALLQKHPFLDVATMSDASTSTTTELLHVSHSGVGATMWDRSFPNTKRFGNTFITKTENAWKDQQILKILPSLIAGTHQLGLEDPNNCQHQYNTGWMFWKATNRSISLLSEWIRQIEPMLQSFNPDDQLTFYKLARTNAQYCNLPTATPSTLTLDTCGGDPALQPAWAGTACLGLLNLVQFANGFVYQSQRAHEQYGVVPHVYHATYSQNKRLSLEEEGFFYEHRPVDEMFLAYEEDVPQYFFGGNFTTWQNSYELVQHQLKQFRSALRMAILLNRTIVLPRMALACQCFFYAPEPTSCTITGIRMRLPYVAPTDHWLKSDQMTIPFKGPGFYNDKKHVFVHKIDMETVRQGDTQLLNEFLKLSKIKYLKVTGNLHDHHMYIQEAKKRAVLEDLEQRVLGSWCCADEGVHPNVKTFKARYTWSEEGKLTDANDKQYGHGTCGL